MKKRSYVNSYLQSVINSSIFCPFIYKVIQKVKAENHNVEWTDIEYNRLLYRGVALLIMNNIFRRRIKGAVYISCWQSQGGKP